MIARLTTDYWGYWYSDTPRRDRCDNGPQTAKLSRVHPTTLKLGPKCLKGVNTIY